MLNDNVLIGADLSDIPLRRKRSKHNARMKKTVFPRFPQRPASCIQRFLRSSKHLKLFKPRAHGRFREFPAASAAFECGNVISDHQSQLISLHPGSRCGSSGSPVGELINQFCFALLIWKSKHWEIVAVVIVSLLLQHLEQEISFQFHWRSSWLTKQHDVLVFRKNSDCVLLSVNGAIAFSCL